MEGTHHVHLKNMTRHLSKGLSAKKYTKKVRNRNVAFLFLTSIFVQPINFRRQNDEN